MTHPYRTITEHVGSLQSLFNIYPYMDTFKKIWEDEQYKGDFSIPTKIIKYIVFAFSIESEKITPNGDRGAEMRRIFKEMEIDENLYTNVVLLEDPNIREAAAKWLDYQDEPQLLYLWTLQMAYTQQQSASISNLVKNGVIDYDQKQKCVEHMRQLKVWIKDAQQELLQNHDKLKEVYKGLDIDNTSKKAPQRGMEFFLKKYGNGDN